METGRFDSTHNVCYVDGESEDHGRRRTVLLEIEQMQEANTAGIFVAMLKELRNYKNAEDRCKVFTESSENCLISDQAIAKRS
jgi:hypothetical protein